jgi:hypothetical protein
MGMNNKHRPRGWLIALTILAGVFIIWMLGCLGGRLDAPQPVAADVPESTRLAITGAREAQDILPIRSAPPPAAIPAAVLPKAVSNRPPGLLRPTAAASAAMEARFRAERTGALGVLYDDYFKTAQVPEATQKELLKLLLDAEMRQFRQLTELDSSGVPMVPSREWLVQQQAELRQGAREILGEAGFAQFQNYQQTIPDRILVQQLNQELGGDVLTADQSSQILQAYQEERQRVMGQRDFNALESMSVEQVSAIMSLDFQAVNQAATRRAEAFLNPQQLEALARVQRRLSKPR